MVISVLSTASLAESGTANMATVAVNIGENIVNSMSLIFNVAYLLGILMVISGMYYFHKNNTNPNQGHLKTGIVTLIIGALLLAFPTTIVTAIETAFEESEIAEEFKSELP